MADLVAPPQIFSAWALAAVDPGLYGRGDIAPDPYLAPGTHLRVHAGTGMSFPIAPFAVFPAKSGPTEKLTLDIAGIASSGGRVELSPDEPVSIGLNVPTNFEATVRLDLSPEDPDLELAELLDQQGRLLYARNRPLWNFAAPLLHRLRLRGRGELLITPRNVNLDVFFSDPPGEGPNYVIGLPVGNPLAGTPVQHAWYLGLHEPEADGMARVEEGAPQTLNAMDVPRGPFASLSPGDERDRIAALLGADPDFDRRLNDMLDRDAFPWEQVDDAVTGDVGRVTTHSAHLPPSSLLQMAALDPGMARYLGFSAVYKEWPNLRDQRGEGSSDWDTLGVIGLFALDPRLVDRLQLQLEDPLSGNAFNLLLKLAKAIESRCHGFDPQTLLTEQIEMARQRGAVPAVFVTFAAPVLPPLAPQLPKPDVVLHRWQASDGTAPSHLYRAGFAFDSPPLVSLAALGRDGAKEPETLHRLAGGRAVPLAMGHELEPNARQRFLRRKRRLQRNAGLLAREDIEAAVGETGFIFSGADHFGRFGEPVGLSLGPPERPGPPPPLLRSWIERPQVVTAATSSPGTLKVAVAVPPAAGFTAAELLDLGRAMVTPTLAELPPGALPLVRLELAFNGETRTVDLTQPGVVEQSFALPEVPAHELTHMPLTGRYVDSADRKSELAEQLIAFADLRAPQPGETGVGLYWTSAPGPSPEVELRLSWSGVANGSYRVYVTDAAGVGLAADADRTQTRGRVAVDGCNRMLAGQAIPKAGFRLLSQQPVVAGADGKASYTTRLPRSLATVQFLRVVPVGLGGIEADFDRCPIVPAAVPDSRRPAAPRLEGHVDVATGRAKLRIVADGFDGVRLRGEEPGLFDGTPGAVPPEYRLRRAVSGVIDPIYAPVCGAGLLKLEDAAVVPPVFSADASDPEAEALEPFVRYTYWAEVRLPPERRAPAGVDLLDPPGGIRAADPASREPQSRPFSLASAPRTLLHAPADPPEAPQGAATAAPPDAAGQVAISLTLAQPPRAHAKAIDQYRVAIWTRHGAGRLTPIDNADGAPLAAGALPPAGSQPLTIVLAGPVAPGAPIELRVAYVDPLGRMGPLASIAVTPSP